jgi:hypothetical protein
MTMLFDTPWHTGGFAFGVAGLGTRGDAVAQQGTHGKGILADDVALPGEAADEFIYRITTLPPLLTLLNYFDDGGIEAEGPVGLHTGQAERRKNGVVYGTAAFNVLIGTMGAAPPPPPAFMPRRAVTLLYSVLDPTALPDLTSKDPDEELQLVADFAPFTSVSSPAWQLTRVGGDDGTAPLVVVGAASMSGGRVTQRVAGGASGNTYTVRCTAQGPDGQALIAFGRLPVRTRA